MRLCAGPRSTSHHVSGAPLTYLHETCMEATRHQVLHCHYEAKVDTNENTQVESSPNKGMEVTLQSPASCSSMHVDSSQQSP